MLGQTKSFQKPNLLLITLAVARMKGHSHNYLNFAVSYWLYFFSIFSGKLVIDNLYLFQTNKKLPLAFEF